MAYNNFPTLRGRGWPEKVTPKWSTVRHRAASGAQYNTALMSQPLHEIEIPINYLSATDRSTLETFFNGQLGGAVPFYVVANSVTYLVTFPDGLDFSELLSGMYATGVLKLMEFR